MKIYTDNVFDWATCKLESCVAHDYDGPITELKSGGGRAPAPPDPRVVAQAQSQAEREAAAYNNAITHGNTTTPFGSQTYTGRRDPTTGAMVYDQSITLSPAEQQLLDQQNAQDLQLGNVSGNLLQQVQDAYAGGRMDASGIPDQQYGVQTDDLPALLGADDLQGARQQVQDALYRRRTAYLDPEYEKREQALRTRLSNQGFVDPRNEAYQAEVGSLDRARSFDYGQAQDAAITGGLAEMQGLSGIAGANRAQLYGERMGGAEFSNRARASALEQMIRERNQPLNEFNALRSSTQISDPQFSDAADATTNPADIANYMQNDYNARLNIWNAQQGGRNALLQGLMGLGGQLGSAYIGRPGG